VEPSNTVLSTLPAPASTLKIASGDLNVILGKMQKQLISLKERHSAIQKRIVVVRQIIDGLVSVFGQSSIGEGLPDVPNARTTKPSGYRLTRICSLVRAQSSRPLTVAELMMAMQQKHPDIFTHNRSPRASVTTVLNRLSTYGAVQGAINEKGAKIWWCAGPSEKTKPSPSGSGIDGHSASQSDGCSCGTANPNLVRACRIALMELREPASAEQIYTRIVQRGSFSFTDIEHPLTAVGRALEILNEEESRNGPE
jgi:hypothetical protein